MVDGGSLSVGQEDSLEVCRLRMALLKDAVKLREYSVAGYEIGLVSFCGEKSLVQ